MYIYTNQPKEESEKILDFAKMHSQPIKKEFYLSEPINDVTKVVKENSISEDDLTFQTFENGLKNLKEESEAKDEILSILSTDNSLVVKKDIRSSMPPLRPHNPLLKIFLDAEAVSSKKMEESSFLTNFLDLGPNIFFGDKVKSLHELPEINPMPKLELSK